MWPPVRPNIAVVPWAFRTSTAICAGQASSLIGWSSRYGAVGWAEGGAVGRGSATRSLGRGPVLGDQLRLDDLPDGVLRELGQELDEPRTLVAGQLLPAERVHRRPV